MSLKEEAERLLPPLGLEPHPDLAARYLNLLDLPAGLLQLFVDKGFSLRRCLPFCRLDPAELDVVNRVAAHVRGGRKLEDATTWLLEVAAREGAAVAAVAREVGLCNGAPDALARLEARRFPETTRRRKEIDALCEGLAGRQVGVRYDRRFTAEQIDLVLSVRSLADLSDLLDRLKQPATRRTLDRILRRALGAADGDGEAGQDPWS